MPAKPLTNGEIATLYALYLATDGSTKAHPPEQAIKAKIRKEFKNMLKGFLKDLCKHPERYAVKHPTRGDMTYQITLEGINKLKELGLV